MDAHHETMKHQACEIRAVFHYFVGYNVPEISISIENEWLVTCQVKNYNNTPISFLFVCKHLIEIDPSGSHFVVTLKY